MSTEKIMEQAQVFASAWSVVGGPFDGGDAMEVATQEKDELRRMVAELVEERDALAAKLAIAQGMADTMAMLRSEMIDAGVIDASVAPMFFPESIIPRLLKLAELEGQTDNLLSTCHRLALELECLLLDTKDLAPVSRWWDSAMVALDEWHKAKDSVSARQIPAEPVNVDFGKRGENMFFNIGNQSFLLDYKPEEQGEFDFMKTMLLSAFSRITHGVKTESQPVNSRLLDVATGKIQHRYLGLCPDSTNGLDLRDPDCPACQAIAAAEAQQERLLQDMHDAGREIDRVMAEPAQKAVRLTEDERLDLVSGWVKSPQRILEEFAAQVETAVLRKNGIEVAE